MTDIKKLEGRLWSGVMYVTENLCPEHRENSSHSVVRRQAALSVKNGQKVGIDVKKG